MPTRNEKTGRFEKQPEKPIEETNDYGYYSKKLNKVFDSVEELKAAEEAEEAKKVATKARKYDATKVEEAFKNLNAIKKIYNEKSIEAKKVYLKVVQEARDTYDQIIDELETTLETASNDYNRALEEFTKAHPNYDLTLHDGDNYITLKSTKTSNSDFDTLDDFLKLFFDNKIL